MRICILFLIGPLLTVPLTGAWVARFHGPWHTITQENINKIQIGMTEQEVEAILGAPGKAMIGGVYLPRISIADHELETPSKKWASDKVGVICYFDEEGKVFRIDPARVLPQDWFPDNVLRDLGLKPRRSWTTFAYVY